MFMLEECSNVSLSAAEIAAVLKKDLQNCADTSFSVSGFSTDTRTITLGNCFIALKGETFNGNRYAAQAAEKGAALCILSEQPDPLPAAPYLIVEDTVQAYGLIAAYYLERLKSNGTKVVAITGSSGKTTVKDMTATVLSSWYRTSATVGNHNNHIGLPYTILHMHSGTEAAILEMGMNHEGEIRYLTKIARPDVCIITNIGTAHIGNLGSQDHIFRAKLEIVEGMNPQTGKLIVSAEDRYLAQSAELPVTRENLCYISRCGNAEAALQAVEICESPEHTEFTVQYQEESAKVRLPMTGLHNVTDALLAIQAGLVLGVPLAKSAEALCSFVPGAMRSDRVILGNCTIIRDYYNANPEAMRASLTALQTIAGDAYRIAVLGNMNELGDYAANAHRELGEYAKNIVDAAFFYGPNHADFAKGYGEETQAFTRQGDLSAALLTLLETKSNQPVYLLIKGSRGMQMEHVFEALESALR